MRIINIEPDDMLYIADRKKNKVLKFQVDCIKIKKDVTLVHGTLFDGRKKRILEYNLKYLNCKKIFKDKKQAQMWIEKQLNIKTQNDQIKHCCNCEHTALYDGENDYYCNALDETVSISDYRYISCKCFKGEII